MSPSNVFRTFLEVLPRHMGKRLFFHRRPFQVAGGGFAPEFRPEPVFFLKAEKRILRAGRRSHKNQQQAPRGGIERSAMSDALNA